MNRRMMILPDVYLTCVQSTKFKTGCLSLSLLRPQCREEVSANALIPSVLLRGCREQPDIASISAFLDEHYGASVGTLVRKKGEVQTTGFYADSLEDRFALDGEPLLADQIAFLGRLLLEPVLEDGRFCTNFVEGEKRNLISAIESRIDDKRGYVISQLLRTMCKDEAFGVPRLGDLEDVEPITAETLYHHYRQLLATSRIEIFYHGSEAPERVADLLRQALSPLPRTAPVSFGTDTAVRAGEPREVREKLNVTQGKLAMGLRLGCTAADSEYPAALLMNAVFGAGVTSKLFVHVREERSLCYYANSSLEKFKGIMVISSGVEFSQFDTAREEILRQLDLTAKGEITDGELESARTYLLSSLKSGMDSPGRLDDFSIGQVILGKDGTMADLADALRTVTKDQVAEAASRVQLDTTYFLEGLES